MIHARYARSRFEERSSERETFDASVLMEKFGQAEGEDLLTGWCFQPRLSCEIDLEGGDAAA